MWNSLWRYFQTYFPAGLLSTLKALEEERQHAEEKFAGALAALGRGDLDAASRFFQQAASDLEYMAIDCKTIAKRINNRVDKSGGKA